MRKPTKRYLNAYSALYGNNSLVDRVKQRSSNRAKRQQPEREEQTKLCCWLDSQGILYYAIPNGGRRHRIEAYNLKRAGLKSGVPDLCVPIGRNVYHALYIEMKVPGGIVSDNQRYWIMQLNNKGNLAKVCYSADEAIQLVKQYLGM